MDGKLQKDGGCRGVFLDVLVRMFGEWLKIEDNNKDGKEKKTDELGSWEVCRGKRDLWQIDWLVQALDRLAAVSVRCGYCVQPLTPA